MVFCFEVVKVVGWGDFYIIGFKFYVDENVVVNDGDFLVGQRQLYVFFNEMFVLFIVGMYCYGCVVQYGFWLCCCDNECFIGIGNGVGYVLE